MLQTPEGTACLNGLECRGKHPGLAGLERFNRKEPLRLSRGAGFRCVTVLGAVCQVRVNAGRSFLQSHSFSATRNGL